MHAADLGIDIIITIAIGLVSVGGVWAVLRTTVGDLKNNVSRLMDLVTVVQVMQADKRASDAELDRVRSRGHSNANHIQRLSERVAQCEIALDLHRANGRDITPPPADPDDR